MLAIVRNVVLVVLLLGMAREPVKAGPFEDGVSAYQRGDYATALRLLRPLADQGRTEAQSHLGSMYILGRGVRQDYAEAARWYRMAAELGDAAAQNNLAVMYLRGDGVRRDFVEAVRWYRKAADQGNSGAQFALGVMHEIGQGVRMDYAEATRWYRRAADNGDASAQNALGVMYRNGKSVQQDHAAAAQWFRKAADQGLAIAQFNLGAMFLGRDYAEAARWVRRAADQGLTDAQTLMGTLYNFGDGVPQNFVQAHMWFNLARQNDLRDAIASQMTITQIAEAQRLASQWQPKMWNFFDQFDPPDPYAKFEDTTGGPPSRSGGFDPGRPYEVEKAPSTALRLASTGSGFFVTHDGHLLTNAHVIKDCKVVQTRRADGDVADARVVATSIGDDLALLKVEKRQATATIFRAGVPVRQGEGVTVYGFPLTGLLASTGNLTIGHVTALSGPRDDPRLLQISAAVQPGNSGGPVFDTGGNVVGVVVSKLDALAVAGATGDIPQNINFAIKASVATNFLEAHGVAYVLASGSAELATTAIVDRARSGTVRVDCLR